MFRVLDPWILRMLPMKHAMLLNGHLVQLKCDKFDVVDSSN